MLKEFLDAWNDPAMRHAMIVHFPIVLSIVGIPLAVAAALTKDRVNTLRWTALLCYLMLAVCGLAASLAGDRAQEAIPGLLDEQARAVLEEHEEMGSKVWPIAVAVGALVAAGFLRMPRVRVASSWLAVAGGLFLVGWVGATASHGGHLVYEYGAGTHAEFVDVLEGAPSAAADADARVTFFREQVRPILLDHCMRCHNHLKKKVPGGLDQTTIAGLLKGGRSGPAIEPGRPAESLLIQAARGTDPDLVMPPGDNPRLSEQQIAILERWISDGAVWEPFELQLPGD